MAPLVKSAHRGIPKIVDFVFGSSHRRMRKADGLVRIEGLSAKLATAGSGTKHIYEVGRQELWPRSCRLRISPDALTSHPFRDR